MEAWYKALFSAVCLCLCEHAHMNKDDLLLYNLPLCTSMSAHLCVCIDIHQFVFLLSSLCVGVWVCVRACVHGKQAPDGPNNLHISTLFHKIMSCMGVTAQWSKNKWASSTIKVKKNKKKTMRYLPSEHWWKPIKSLQTPRKGKKKYFKVRMSPSVKGTGAIWTDLSSYIFDVGKWFLVLCS